MCSQSNPTDRKDLKRPRKFTAQEFDQMKVATIFFGVFLLDDVAAFVQPTTRSSGIQRPSSLSVSQQEKVVEKSTKKEDASYIVARGDGSTGGGGLPMPKQLADEDDDGLKRPKVGAEMPNG